MSTLDDMISKFNAQAQNHLDSQSLNPFSGSFSRRSPSPRPGQEDYGKPVSGSKTELRGLQAKSHVNREILELCDTIYDLAAYNLEIKKRLKEAHPEDIEDEEIVDDGSVIVTFGELFDVYTKINNKVVGLLIAAKKKGLVYFEKEMLFQRRDDDELIALKKPIEEIRKIMRDVLTPSPVPLDSEDEPSTG